MDNREEWTGAKCIWQCISQKFWFKEKHVLVSESWYFSTFILQFIISNIDNVSYA